MLSVVADTDPQAGPAKVSGHLNLLLMHFYAHTACALGCLFTYTAGCPVTWLFGCIKLIALYSSFRELDTAGCLKIVTCSGKSCWKTLVINTFLVLRLSHYLYSLTLCFDPCLKFSFTFLLPFFLLFFVGDFTKYCSWKWFCDTIAWFLSNRKYHIYNFVTMQVASLKEPRGKKNKVFLANRANGQGFDFFFFKMICEIMDLC